MRIAHIVRELDPAKGGPPTVIINTVRALARAGVEVELWTWDAFGTRIDPDDVAPGSVRIIEHREPRGRFDRDFFHRFDDAWDGIELVHLHQLWAPYSARFTFEARRRGVPSVMTLHGMLMDWPLGEKRLKKQFYLALVGARQLRATSAVHVLNEPEARQSSSRGIRFPGFILPNGIDPGMFDAPPAPGRFRARHPAIGDRVLIASLGRLHHVKGPDLLLDAFLAIARDRDDLALVLAGPDEGMRPTLDRMLDRHPARDRVILPGLVTGDDRLALLADADVFAHTSHHETASMAILEAAHAGKPLLITSTSHCPEVATLDAGIVVPPTAAAIRDGLERLLDDRARWAEIGANARRMTLERFTLDAVIPSLIRHYERLIAGERYPVLG
ncbi:MAG: glycosyltransferase [Phycisphaerales bacterium]|nr:glycosyltransferase [Phycisphaerales bacterium]